MFSTSEKCFLAVWVTYAATFALTKVSLLLLYGRLFPVHELRVACALCGFLVIALSMGVTIVGFLQCRPVRYIWDKTVTGGVCLPFEPLLYGTAIPALLLDVMVICLPMPVIWGLQMKAAHKMVVIGILCLGSL